MRGATMTVDPLPSLCFQMETPARGRKHHISSISCFTPMIARKKYMTAQSQRLLELQWKGTTALYLLTVKRARAKRTQCKEPKARPASYHRQSKMSFTILTVPRIASFCSVSHISRYHPPRPRPRPRPRHVSAQAPFCL